MIYRRACPPWLVCLIGKITDKNFQSSIFITDNQVLVG